MTTSESIFHIISIDSFFNSILFLFIYNMQSTKADKLSYYYTFIHSMNIRYLYFFLLWVISFILGTLLDKNIDISILACPIFVYLFYNKLYFHRVVDWIYKKCQLKIQYTLCYVLYQIIQFLSTTILLEPSNIRENEIMEFYSQMKSDQINEFFQSFLMACLYEYLNSQYSYIGYVMLINQKKWANNYEKKQYILGILNAKDWNRLFQSDTITLFFDIYKNSNNKQIAEFIQRQITIFKYKFITFFSVWSIVAFMGSSWIIPFIFYYINTTQWKENRNLLVFLSVVSILNPDIISSIAFFIIPVHFHYEIMYWITSLNLNIMTVVYNVIGLIVGYIFPFYLKVFYSLLSLIFLREKSQIILFYSVFGFLSNYSIEHLISLFALSFVWNVYTSNFRLNIKK